MMDTIGSAPLMSVVRLIVSFYSGNRKLPMIVMLLGLVLLFAPIGSGGLQA